MGIHLGAAGTVRPVPVRDGIAYSKNLTAHNFAPTVADMGKIGLFLGTLSDTFKDKIGIPRVSTKPGSGLGGAVAFIDKLRNVLGQTGQSFAEELKEKFAKRGIELPKEYRETRDNLGLMRLRPGSHEVNVAKGAVLKELSALEKEAEAQGKLDLEI